MSENRGNRTSIGYRLAWARNYLKRYGVLTNSSRGIWALTQTGREQTTVSSTEVVKYVTKLNKDKGKEKPHEPDELRTLAWKEKALEIVQNISPDAFERLCQLLLREAGFTSVKVTGKSNDGGIDGKGVLRISGLLSFHVIFQSKRYKGSISPSIIRDFRGAMVGRADKGLLITTGNVTQEAKKEAKRDGAPPIDLIDGSDLMEKLKEFEMGILVYEKIIEDIKIDSAYFKNL